jgi:hypothetical protein
MFYGLLPLLLAFVYLQSLAKPRRGRLANAGQMNTATLALAPANSAPVKSRAFISPP